MVLTFAFEGSWVVSFSRRRPEPLLPAPGPGLLPSQWGTYLVPRSPGRYQEIVSTRNFQVAGKPSDTTISCRRIPAIDRGERQVIRREMPWQTAATVVRAGLACPAPSSYRKVQGPNGVLQDGPAHCRVLPSLVGTRMPP